MPEIARGSAVWLKAMRAYYPADPDVLFLLEAYEQIKQAMEVKQRELDAYKARVEKELDEERRKEKRTSYAGGCIEPTGTGATEPSGEGTGDV